MSNLALTVKFSFDRLTVEAKFNRQSIDSKYGVDGILYSTCENFERNIITSSLPLRPPRPSATVAVSLSPSSPFSSSSPSPSNPLFAVATASLLRHDSDRLHFLNLPPLPRVLRLHRFSLPISSLAKNRRRPLLPLHLALLHPFASASPPPSTVRRSSPPPTSSSLPRVPLSASNNAVAAVPRPDLLYFRPCHRPAMPLPHSSVATVFIHQHCPPSPFSLVSSIGSCPPRLLLIASATASPPSLRHSPLNLAGAAACLFFSVLRRCCAFPSSLSPMSSPSSSSAATSSPSPPSSPPLLLHRCRHDVGMGIG